MEVSHNIGNIINEQLFFSFRFIKQTQNYNGLLKTKIDLPWMHILYISNAFLKVCFTEIFITTGWVTYNAQHLSKSVFEFKTAQRRSTK